MRKEEGERYVGRLKGQRFAQSSRWGLYEYRNGAFRRVGLAHSPAECRQFLARKHPLLDQQGAVHPDLVRMLLLALAIGTALIYVARH